MLEPVGGAAELAACCHVVGCELGWSDADVLQKFGVSEVEGAGEREFERVDGAAGARSDGLGFAGSLFGRSLGSFLGPSFGLIAEGC